MSAHKLFSLITCKGKTFLFEKTQNKIIPEILQIILKSVYSTWLLNFPYGGDVNLRLFDQCVQRSIWVTFLAVYERQICYKSIACTQYIIYIKEARNDSSNISHSKINCYFPNVKNAKMAQVDPKIILRNFFSVLPLKSTTTKFDIL